MRVCQPVPVRNKIDEDQRGENREPFKYEEGADRRGRDGLTNNRPQHLKIQSAVFMARFASGGWIVTRRPRFTTFEPPEAANWAP